MGGRNPLSSKSDTFAWGGGDLKETLQNSVGGTTSVRKSLLLIAQILTG